jgi:hypothetical protein
MCDQQAVDTLRKNPVQAGAGVSYDRDDIQGLYRSDVHERAFQKYWVAP